MARAARGERALRTLGRGQVGGYLARRRWRRV